MAKKYTVQDMGVLTIDSKTWIELRIWSEDGIWETFDRARAACLYFKLQFKHINEALPLLAQWDPKGYAELKQVMDSIQKQKQQRKE